MNCNRTTHGQIRSFVVRLLYISILINRSGYQDLIRKNIINIHTDVDSIC